MLTDDEAVAVVLDLMVPLRTRPKFGGQRRRARSLTLRGSPRVAKQESDDRWFDVSALVRIDHNRRRPLTLYLSFAVGYHLPIAVRAYDETILPGHFGVTEYVRVVSRINS